VEERRRVAKQHAGADFVRAAMQPDATVLVERATRPTEVGNMGVEDGQ